MFEALRVSIVEVPFSDIFIKRDISLGSIFRVFDNTYLTRKPIQALRDLGAVNDRPSSAEHQWSGRRLLQPYTFRWSCCGFMFSTTILSSRVIKCRESDCTWFARSMSKLVREFSSNCNYADFTLWYTPWAFSVSSSCDTVDGAEGSTFINSVPIRR